MSNIPVALQLYTVRDDLNNDFENTIARVAEIGYRAVELAGYHGRTAEDVKEVLMRHDIQVAGSHVALERLEKELPDVVMESHALANRFVVVPFLAESRRQSLDDYRKLAAQMNDLGRQLKDAGLTLCYHNHAFEFEMFGGDTSGFDAFFDATDPQLVQVELDTFWVKKGGQDPVAYLQKYAGRTPLVHLKDMTPAPEATFAPVGAGTIDYAPLIAAAEAAESRWFVVEQDSCQGAPLDAVKTSFDNLKNMGVIENG